MLTKQAIEVKQLLGEALRELGCTESETEMYVVSLLLGPVSVTHLARELSVARPNAYKIIRSLGERGLVDFGGKRKFARTFQVASPTIILEKLRQKQRFVEDGARTLSQAMPEIISLFRQEDLPARAKVLVGREQFINLFWSILEEGEPPLRFLGSIRDFVGFISWHEERKWIAERIRRGHSIQALLFRDKDSEIMRSKDTEEMRETRFLANMSPFKTSFQLFGNKAVFWQPTTPAAILVADEMTVEMLKSIFDRLWADSAPKDDPVL